MTKPLQQKDKFQQSFDSVLDDIIYFDFVCVYEAVIGWEMEAFSIPRLGSLVQHSQQALQRPA